MIFPVLLLVWYYRDSRPKICYNNITTWKIRKPPYLAYNFKLTRLNNRPYIFLINLFIRVSCYFRSTLSNHFAKACRIWFPKLSGMRRQETQTYRTRETAGRTAKTERRETQGKGNEQSETNPKAKLNRFLVLERIFYSVLFKTTNKQMGNSQDNDNY